MPKNNKFINRSLMAIALLALAAFGFAASAGAQGADINAPAVTSVTPANGSTIYANGGSTVYYQSGNSTPMVIKADYSDEAGGSGVDPTSVMVHLDVGNMLFDCPVQTASHVECNATASDLAPGTHLIDVYVSDMDGNPTVNRTMFNVVVDNAAPTYANLSPAGGSIIYTSQLTSTSINDPDALRIDYDLSDPAPSSGWSPMTHINESVPPGVAGAMISNTSCVKTPSATDPTHSSCQMNRAKLLHLGDNTLSILLKDKVGNKSSDYTDPSALKHYTVIDDVAPAISNMTADPAAIAADYTDPLPAGALSTMLASGVDPSSALVEVDGNAITDGCTASATGISCPTPGGLAAGSHPVEVTVSDNAGNQATASATLNVDESAACTGERPSLLLSMSQAYWADYDDYQARTLSINYAVRNAGTLYAQNAEMTSGTATNGVILMTAMPASVGNIAGGAIKNVILRYSIPEGVTGFRTVNTAAAEDGCGTYTYP